VEVSGTSKERGAVGFIDLGGLLLNQFTDGWATNHSEPFSMSASVCTPRSRLSAKFVGGPFIRMDILALD
jgi:hypothetical protein